MNRKYELKERARRQAQTRQRIVEATVDLHTSVGPARTTISAIAARAGVERHTVYAHFPDDRTLFRACSAHWTARHPMPNLETLAEIEDPVRRLRRALGEMTADIALLADAVSQGRPGRKSVRAAIGHALEFETWRSLVRRQGLSRTQAVDAMARLASSV